MAISALRAVHQRTHPARVLKEGQRFVLIFEDEEGVALSPEELAVLNDRLEGSERGENLASREQLWASLGRSDP